MSAVSAATRRDIVIVGGGASGLIAAISARWQAPSLSVTIVERQPRVGRKLIATGNGRCNLTNQSADPGRFEAYYHGDTEFMRPAMTTYPPERVIAFFKSIGVEPLFEGDKVYPASEQASSVLDALRLSCEELGVETLTEFDAVSVDKPSLSVHARDGRSIECQKLIVACGSPASPGLGGTDSGLLLLHSLGIKTKVCFPALVQLRTEAQSIKPLAGIKIDASISIEVDGARRRLEVGEILFTDYGLSGPPVLQLSRVASEALAGGRRVDAVISILPDDPALILDRLKSRRAALPARQLLEFLTGMLNKRLGQTLLKLAGCAPLNRAASTLSDSELGALANLLSRWAIPVTGTQGFASAQVAAGGARCDQFDPDTLQYKLQPGLYVTGELLDVDGDCGGFNLQWAWASGLLAGRCAAEALTQ